MITQIEPFLSWLLVEKGYSPHTADSYQRDLREFIRFCGDDCAPEQVTALTVRAFVATLYATNAAASVARLYHVSG